MEDSAFERVVEILRTYRSNLDRLAAALLEREEILGTEVLDILDIEPELGQDGDESDNRSLERVLVTI